MTSITSVIENTSNPRKVKPRPRRADTKLIRISLIRRGWSVTELALRVGHARPYVSQLVHDRVRRRRAQERIAHTLGLPFNEAFPEVPK